MEKKKNWGIWNGNQVLSHFWLSRGTWAVDWNGPLCVSEKCNAPPSDSCSKISWTEEPLVPVQWIAWERDTTEQLHFHFSLCIGHEMVVPLVFSLENPQGWGAPGLPLWEWQSQTWLKYWSGSSSVVPSHNQLLQHYDHKHHPGSLICGVFQAEYWRGVPFLPKGIFPTQGLSLPSLASPYWQGQWEAQNDFFSFDIPFFPIARHGDPFRAFSWIP